jgi:hypothetical protein
VLNETIDGGPAIDWTEMPPLSYPESEFVAYKQARKWKQFTVDLPGGKDVATIRLYQTILVPNRIPGNAYWKDVAIG